MNGMVDAFWRAAMYCMHPRIILWSLLPLMVAGAGALGLGWLFWESAVAAVRALLEQWSLVMTAFEWLESVGAQSLRTLIAPLIVVALAVPLIVIAALLLVALMMTPAIVDLVAARRFPSLERKHGGGWFQGLMWSLACTVAALVALVVSLPLWFVPPLVLILPPLIWGWLTYRVMAFDVLSAHASVAERRELMRRHRWPLLAIGMVSGYLGAAPSLLWAASAATLIFAPVLVVLSVWLYTLVFAFAACWFAHFGLAALAKLRAEAVVEVPPVEPVPTVERIDTAGSTEPPKPPAPPLALPPA